MRCKYCGSADIVRAGKRKAKDGSRQLYRCNSCLHRFSNTNRSGKRTDARVVLDALTLYCQGYSLEEIRSIIRLKNKASVSIASLSRWIREYDPPYLAIRHLNRKFPQVIRSHLFTHHGLSYHYKVHVPKTHYCEFEALKKYLFNLPSFLDHHIFEDSARCSELTLCSNPGLKERHYGALSKAALSALPLASSNRERHAVVEEYLLCCDRNTLAVETPVYYFDKELGSITGHIDILQVNFGKIHILDFKPKAAKEKPEKVVTQLSLYARALSFRTGISTSQMMCAYFDEEHCYEFEPQPLKGATKEQPHGIRGIPGERTDHIQRPASHDHENGTDPLQHGM